MPVGRGLKLGLGTVGGFLALEYAGYGPFSRSKGVQNIESAWSRGGGSHDHTPAIKSKLGDPDIVVGEHGHQGGYGNPSTVKYINEARSGGDNVVVARNKRQDTYTPGGSGLADQKPDQSGQTIEPLRPGSPSDSKR